MFQYEDPKSLGVGCGDMDQIVVGARDEIDVQYLVEFGQLLPELGQVRTCIGLHPNGDHGL